jgi:hypothetical protein
MTGIVCAKVVKMTACYSCMVSEHHNIRFILFFLKKGDKVISLNISTPLHSVMNNGVTETLSYVGRYEIR